jgi:hypothetical protein
LAEDPYEVPYVPNNLESLPQHEQRRWQKYLKIRDERWDTIKLIVYDAQGNVLLDMYSPEKRGMLIKQAIQKTGRSKTYVYDSLRLFWKSGQTKNGLFPHYYRSGARGKTRRNYAKKRGAPRKRASVVGLSQGVNVSEEIRAKFHRGHKLFYEIKENKKRPLRHAYNWTLEHIFNQGYKQKENGTLSPILPSDSECPTFRQFKYWVSQDIDPIRSMRTRVGRRHFNLRLREILGDSTSMAFGPGSLVQVDATIGDIYLVHHLNRRRIIGRPVIYVLIDVFSRLIMGIAITLEGPSWLGAALALDNMATDKVALCSTFDFSIAQYQWPSHHLPEAILADGGELKGYNSVNLVDSLNIRTHNAAPFRADWKGIVERNFRRFNEKFIKWTPGAVYTPHERGDSDYRLDACLTMREFTRLMISCVLHHNNEHRMDWYNMDEFMIADNVDPYPIDLWKYGIQNRTGHLRQPHQNILRLNLLPRGEASITPRGLLFEGLQYDNQRFRQEGRYTLARMGNSEKVVVVYDPRSLKKIYLPYSDGRALEPCYLHENEQAFWECNYYERLDYLEVQEQKAIAAEPRSRQSRADFNAEAERIVAQAKEMTTAAWVGVEQSRRSRLQGIRDNRRDARSLEREAGVWDLTKDDPLVPNNDSEVFQQPLQDDDEYIPAPIKIDILRTRKKD